MMPMALKNGFKVDCAASKKWQLWSRPALQLTDSSLRNQVPAQVFWKSFLKVLIQQLVKP